MLQMFRRNDKLLEDSVVSTTMKLSIRYGNDTYEGFAIF